MPKPSTEDQVKPKVLVADAQEPTEKPDAAAENLTRKAAVILLPNPPIYVMKVVPQQVVNLLI